MPHVPCKTDAKVIGTKRILFHSYRMVKTTPTSAHRAVTAVHWLLMTSGIVFLIVSVGFVLRARVSLGFWPQYNTPDPKELGYTLHLTAIVAAFILVCTSNIYLIFASALRYFHRHINLRVSWIVLLLSDLVCFVFLKFNILNFFEWILD
jgi:hypothetical protein